MENNLSIVKDTFKELPNNTEAEQSVIGPILVSNEIFDEINNIISSINIDLNLSQEHQLNNGDLITVREIGASDSKVEVFGKVKVPGEYSALNMSLKNILDIAGGFDDPVFRKTIRENKS